MVKAGPARLTRSALVKAGPARLTRSALVKAGPTGLTRSTLVKAGPTRLARSALVKAGPTRLTGSAATHAGPTRLIRSAAVPVIARSIGSWSVVTRTIRTTVGSVAVKGRPPRSIIAVAVEIRASRTVGFVAVKGGTTWSVIVVAVEIGTSRTVGFVAVKGGTARSVIVVAVEIRTTWSAGALIFFYIWTSWTARLIHTGAIRSARFVVLIPIRTIRTSVIIPIMIGARRTAVVIPFIARWARTWRWGIIARTAWWRWRRRIVIILVVTPRIPVVVPISIVIIAWAPPETVSAPVPTTAIEDFIQKSISTPLNSRVDESITVIGCGDTVDRIYIIGRNSNGVWIGRIDVNVIVFTADFYFIVGNQLFVVVGNFTQLLYCRVHFVVFISENVCQIVSPVHIAGHIVKHIWSG